jgi:DNA-3-methyladenine glycosylase
MSQVLPQRFYERDTAKVARDLLGKKLVRNYKNMLLEGIIVETEAYFGQNDPASRAFRGKKSYNKVMFEESGFLFIYNVHMYWMLNFVAHEKGKTGGILIRAIEPTKGITTMKHNRPVTDIRELTNGPGKLSLALGINKKLNGMSTFHQSSEVQVHDNSGDYEIGRTHRIGVTKDLEEELRFIIKGNRFLSRY